MTTDGYDIKRNGNGISSFHYAPKKIMVGFNVPDPQMRNSLGILILTPEELGTDGLMSEFNTLFRRLYSSPTELFADIKGTRNQRRRAYKDIYSQINFESGIGAHRMIYTADVPNNQSETLVKSFDIPFSMLTGGSKQNVVVYEDGEPYAALVEVRDDKKDEPVIRLINNTKVIHILRGSLESNFEQPLKVLENEALTVAVPIYSGGVLRYERILLSPGNGIGLNRRESVESLETLLS